MIPPPDPGSARGMRWLPAVPALLGLALLAASLANIEPGFHFSCDGAFKEYNLRLWMKSGTIFNELTMPGAPDWAREIWRENYFPIRPPFEFERKIVFPPFFQLMSLPFYAAFGYRGLFVLPAFSVVALWGLMWHHWRRSGMDGLPALTGMSLLALSPLTFYGAIFWEHSTAVLLFMTGFLSAAAGIEGREAEANGSSPARWRGAAGGAALVLAQAMRPELILWTLVAAAIAAVSPRRRGFALGAGAMAIACAAVNTASTGHPLGIHHMQERFLARGDALGNVIEYFRTTALDLATMTPSLVVALLAAAALFTRSREARWERGGLLAGFLLSLLLLVLVLPNLGDFQLYRRYFLIVIPAGAALAARLARDRPRFGWALLAIQVLSMPMLVYMRVDHAWHFRERIKPLYQVVELRAPKAVITICNDATLDFAPLMHRVPFFQVRTLEDIQDVMERIAPHVNPMEAAFVFLRHPLDPVHRLRTLRLPDGRDYTVVKTGFGRGIFYLFRLEPTGGGGVPGNPPPEN